MKEGSERDKSGSGEKASDRIVHASETSSARDKLFEEYHSESRSKNVVPAERKEPELSKDKLPPLIIDGDSKTPGSKASKSDKTAIDKYSKPATDASKPATDGWNLRSEASTTGEQKSKFSPSEDLSKMGFPGLSIEQPSSDKSSKPDQASFADKHKKSSDSDTEKEAEQPKKEQPRDHTQTGLDTKLSDPKETGDREKTTPETSPKDNPVDRGIHIGGPEATAEKIKEELTDGKHTIIEGYDLSSALDGRRLVVLGVNPESMGGPGSYVDQFLRAVPGLKEKGMTLVGMEMVPATSEPTITAYGKAKSDYEEAKKIGASTDDLARSKKEVDEQKKKLETELTDFRKEIPEIAELAKSKKPDPLVPKLIDLIDKVQEKGLTVVPLEPGARMSPDGLVRESAFVKTIDEKLRNPGAKMAVLIGQWHARRDDKSGKPSMMDRLADPKRGYNPLGIAFAGHGVAAGDPLATLTEAAKATRLGTKPFAVQAATDPQYGRFADLYLYDPS